MPSQSLIDGFIASAQRVPKAAALHVDGETLSYEDLAAYSQQIAQTILVHEPAAKPLAAVFAYRSRTSYAAVLGVLASGKGYVPLNPKFPAFRTSEMLHLSEVNFVVAGKECFKPLSEVLSLLSRPLTILLPDSETPCDLAADFPGHRFISASQMHKAPDFQRISTDPENPAYLLFTSGSTGSPKGVPVSHSNVCSYIKYICTHYAFQETDRFSQTFDPTFDLSVHDMFVCWTSGGCLFSIPEASVMAPAKFLREHQLTAWFSVPSVGMVMDKLRMLKADSFPSLRYSFFCGEPLSRTLAEKWQAAAPQSVVENLYGPTETTIAISNYRFDPQSSEQRCLNDIVPIGWAFKGQNHCVIDADHQPLARGKVGELCFNGSQVTQGYLNAPSKTKENYVLLPEAGPGIWYRTGDRVSEDPDGCLHYLGRTDDQIKVMGYRVELQEIDFVLRKAAVTEMVAAVAWPGGAGRAEAIVGFIAGAGEPDENKILTACRKLLPDYMVPRELHFIDSMPLNANGKVSRSALLQKLAEDLKPPCTKTL